MSAAPLSLHSSASQGLILKLGNTPYTLDPFHDRLTSIGYEVLDASTYQQALQLAYNHRPELVVVYDDPDNGIDALEWLEQQHNGPYGWLAATPVMVLVNPTRAEDLRSQEINERVVLLQLRADTLNQLSRTIKYLLHRNRWEPAY